MKNKAFTLIELLVVILIIAVLAGIVFAQYQKSILKSRFSTLVPIAKALNDGQEMFLLSHGKYADKLENLDVEIASGASGNTATINGNIITLGANKRHTYIKVTKENFDNNLIMFQNGSKYFPGEIHCEAKEGKTLANWLCQKELSGTKLDRSLTEGYNDYVINGDGNGVFLKNFTNVSGTSENRISFDNGDSCTSTENYQCTHADFTNESTCYGYGFRDCGTDNNFINSTCEAYGYHSCLGATFTDSICNSVHNMSCQETTFKGYSTCEAYESDSCEQATFKDNSICNANGGGTGACVASTFEDNSACYVNESAGCGGHVIGGEFIPSVYSDKTSCHGDSYMSCNASLFKDNSICYANAPHTCGEREIYGNIYQTTYEGNACCKGDFCPGNAPKCDCDIDPNTGQHALSC